MTLARGRARPQISRRSSEGSLGEGWNSVNDISFQFKFKFSENISKNQEMEENVMIHLKLGECRVCGHEAQH
jgi:hypothetical protein